MTTINQFRLLNAFSFLEVGDAFIYQVFFLSLYSFLFVSSSNDIYFPVFLHITSIKHKQKYIVRFIIYLFYECDCIYTGKTGKYISFDGVLKLISKTILIR